jgi:transposase-like protein
MRRRYTGKERSELVDLVNEGRATVSEAAARLGVGPSTAYYWMRNTATTTPGHWARRRGPKTQALAMTRFVRVVPSHAVEATIAVRVGAAEIQVRRDFDADLLRAVVDALRDGAA